MSLIQYNLESYYHVKSYTYKFQQFYACLRHSSRVLNRQLHRKDLENLNLCTTLVTEAKISRKPCKVKLYSLPKNLNNTP